MLPFHNIFNSVWAIDPAYAANYLPILDAWLKGERPIKSFRSAQKPELSELNAVHLAIPSSDAFEISEYGNWVSPEDAPRNSIAIIHIKGSITKDDQECGPAGMVTKANILKQCYENDNIKSVVLVIDSGGGESMAMIHLTETIAKRNKLVGCFIEDFAASAAIGIATACDYVAVNSSLARVGSIGTYLTVADYSKRYEMMGINLIDIYASASSDKNQEYIQAIKGNPEPLRKMVDTFNEHFLSMIETNRKEKLTADRTVWGTGKMWFAEEALQLGIIDKITDFETFINYFNT